MSLLRPPALEQNLYRAVRTEASAVLDALAAGVGRGLAAALRPLSGPWWLAQFDPAAEAARAARGAFQTAFPGPRQREALLFCRTQVPSGQTQVVCAAMLCTLYCSQVAASHRLGKLK